MLSEVHSGTSLSSSAAIDTGKTSYSSKVSQDDVSRAINKMLLFPIVYIFLWSGGLANRLVEATGNTSEVTTFLQALTQLVGFCNALVYAYSLWQRRK